MSKLTASIVFIFSCMMVACQKEASEELATETVGSLQGDYKFISIEANTVATDQVTDGSDVEKAITRSHYISKNNSGTVKFDGQAMISSNLAYSIDTTAKVYMYFNGTLEDSLEVPFAFSVPPTSSSVPYTKVGADSLYFSSGSIFMGGVSQQPTAPAGARMRYEGKRLLLTTSFSQTTTETMQGLPVVSSREAKVVITLQKM